MKNLTTIIYLLLCINISSQNLVTNYGFENYQSISKDQGTIKVVDDWWSPFGEAKYFNSNNNYKTPYRKYIPPGEDVYQSNPVYPFKGKAYVGLSMSGVIDSDEQDYLMTQLSEPLQKGLSYRVSMYVRLGEVWKYIDFIGAYFSKNEYSVSKDQTIFHYIPYKNDYEIIKKTKRGSLIFREDTLQLLNDTLKLNNRDDWVKIQGEYLAKGGEEYLTIGNFSINRNGLFNNNIAPKVKSEFYDYYYHDNTFYFIDNISVSPLEIKDSKVYKNFSSNIVEEEAIILNNILFDLGKASLQPPSYQTLNLLLTYMQENDQLNLLIEGHTDNTGTEKKNKLLSENRAKAIADYLIANNIASDRLKSIGYGSSKPSHDNLTDENRAKNRRVEFTLTSKQ
ncbi:OmpA family protein [Carboxylicivirga sp. RSCT41]|uniref:OmpA family protein n=1 Tax=Carboxylicivirga agarovorans TaxID=3417570 RepID=UPI003D353470